MPAFRPAELLRMLVRTDPSDETSRTMLARVLRAIAYDANTSNQRHYLLTEARVMDGAIDLDTEDLLEGRFIGDTPEGDRVLGGVVGFQGEAAVSEHGVPAIAQQLGNVAPAAGGAAAVANERGE